MGYKEYRFNTPDKAFQKQKEMKRNFGYKPEVYAIKTSDGSAWFGFAVPHGIIPVNRKDKIFDL
jgi:hypothetical protein